MACVMGTSVHLPDLWQQFVLSPRACKTLDGFAAHESGGWHLYTHPALPVRELAGGAGWLLGEAVPLEGGQALPPADGVERWQRDMAGRYAVVLTGMEPRLYLDAGGTLAAVYSEEAQLVASTTSAGAAALGEQPSVKESRERYRRGRSNSFWPAGLTSDARFARLLPNHRLDLRSWRAVRCWPSAAPAAVADPATFVAERLGRAIERAAQRHGAAYLPLTGGKDSRALVAAALARGLEKRITFVSFASENPYTVADLKVARRIVTRFGLEHRALWLGPERDADKERYLLRIGCDGSWGKSRDFDRACSEQLELGGVWMTGFAGEVGRAFYWENDPAPPDGAWPDARDLLARMGVPVTDATERAMGGWLQDAPKFLDRTQLLDLAYLEQRLGAWASVHLYGAAHFTEQLLPFADRAIFEAMMGTPAEYRRAGTIMVDIVRAACPRLLEIPYGPIPGAVERLVAGLPVLDGAHRRLKLLQHRIAYQRGRRAVGLSL